MLSPSNSIVCRPSAASRISSAFASVDFPAPDSPVNHKVFAFCPIRRSRSSFVTSESCQVRFSKCFNAFSITPQADVIWVIRSINISPPRLSLFSNRSNTIFSVVKMLQTTIPFFSTCDTGICSPVFTSILYSIFTTLAGIFFVPSFIIYSLPSTSGTSSIQSIVTRNIFPTSGACPLAMTHPREQSISLSKHIVTGCPFTTSSVSSPDANSLDTAACSPLGYTVITSPTRRLPASTCP